MPSSEEFAQEVFELAATIVSLYSLSNNGDPYAHKTISYRAVKYSY